MADVGELKQWMDKQIEIVEESKKYLDFSESISLCDFFFNKKIHVYSGIGEIAKTLGLKLNHRKMDDETLEYFVDYNGYAFFSCATKMRDCDD